MLKLVSKLDAREVEKSLAELERRGQNPLPAMRVIRMEMRTDQRDHASGKEGPDGKWPPRSAATIKAARKGSGRPRRFMGRLTTAVDYLAQHKQVIGRSKIPWSGAHQEGATVGKGVKLPARPFLWISDRLLEVSARVLTRFIVNGWGKR